MLRNFGADFGRDEKTCSLQDQGELQVLSGVKSIIVDFVVRVVSDHSKKDWNVVVGFVFAREQVPHLHVTLLWLQSMVKLTFIDTTRLETDNTRLGTDTTRLETDTAHNYLITATSGKSHASVSKASQPDTRFRHCHW